MDSWNLNRSLAIWLISSISMMLIYESSKSMVYWILIVLKYALILWWCGLPSLAIILMITLMFCFRITSRPVRVWRWDEDKTSSNYSALHLSRSLSLKQVTSVCKRDAHQINTQELHILLFGVFSRTSICWIMMFIPIYLALCNFSQISKHNEQCRIVNVYYLP